MRDENYPLLLMNRDIGNVMRGIVITAIHSIKGGIEERHSSSADDDRG